MGRTACTEPQCLYKGALYLIFVVRHRKKQSFFCLLYPEDESQWPFEMSGSTCPVTHQHIPAVLHLQVRHS